MSPRDVSTAELSRRRLETSRPPSRPDAASRRPDGRVISTRPRDVPTAQSSPASVGLSNPARDNEVRHGSSARIRTPKAGGAEKLSLLRTRVLYRPTHILLPPSRPSRPTSSSTVQNQPLIAGADRQPTPEALKRGHRHHRAAHGAWRGQRTELSALLLAAPAASRWYGRSSPIVRRDQQPWRARNRRLAQPASHSPRAAETSSRG